MAGFGRASSRPIDDIDREILKASKPTGRATIVEVARAVALSQNATAAGCGGSPRPGVITGFTTHISPESVGLGLQAYIDVKLRSTSPPTTSSAGWPAYRGCSSAR